MQLGRTGINVEALADISKERFIELMKGKIDIDINEAWKLFSKEAEKFKKPTVEKVDEPPAEQKDPAVPKQSKKRKKKPKQGQQDK